jgi:hypothetical protein
MKKLFKYVKTDKIIRLAISIAFLLLLFEIGFILFSYFSLPPFLPLFNQMTWGDSRLGTRIEIFLPVMITLLFFGLNFFLLNRLYEKMPLVSRMLGITTLLVTILSFIFVARTLQLIL